MCLCIYIYISPPFSARQFLLAPKLVFFPTPASSMSSWLIRHVKRRWKRFFRHFAPFPKQDQPFPASHVSFRMISTTNRDFEDSGVPNSSSFSRKIHHPWRPLARPPNIIGFCQSRRENRKNSRGKPCASFTEDAVPLIGGIASVAALFLERGNGTSYHQEIQVPKMEGF